MLREMFPFKFQINIIQPQSLSFVVIVPLQSLRSLNISDFQRLPMRSTVRNNYSLNFELKYSSQYFTLVEALRFSLYILL